MQKSTLPQNISPKLPNPDNIRTEEDLYRTTRDLSIAIKQLSQTEVRLGNRIRILEKNKTRDWFTEINIFNGANDDSGMCISVPTRSYGVGIDVSDDNIFKITPDCPINGRNGLGITPDGMLRASIGVDINDFSDDETFADMSDEAFVTERAIGAYIAAVTYWDRDPINGYVYLRTQTDWVGLGLNVPVTNLHIYENNADTNPALRIENDGVGDAAIKYYLTGMTEYETGIDNSIGDDPWKLSPESPFSGTAYFVMDRFGNIGHGIHAPTTNVHFYENNAHTVPMFLIEQDGAGDAAMEFLLTGGQPYSMGARLEAGHEEPIFKISPGADLTNTAFVMNEIGRIGLGIVIPLTNLHIYEDNAGTVPAFLIEQDGIGDAVMEFLLTGGQPYSMGIDNSAVGDPFVLTPNATLTGNAHFVMDSTGEIGFGILLPTTNVHIYENNAHTVPAFLIEQDGAGDASLGFLLTGGQAFTSGIDNSEAGDVFKISPGVALTNTDYFVMNAAGDIGIRTITPGYSLEVNGTGGFTGDVTLETGTILHMPDLVGAAGEGIFFGNAARDLGAMQALDSGGSSFCFWGCNMFYRAVGGWQKMELVRPGGIFYFFRDIYRYYNSAGGVVAPTLRFTVHSGGEVGIGVADPDEMLEVNGDIRHTGDSQSNTFGAFQDVGITFDGTDMIADYDLLNAGTTDFRIQENGVDRFVILTGAGEIQIEGSGYLRADTARYRRYYHLAVTSFDPGASGATWESADANQLCGYELNADTDTLEFGTDTHNDWDAASDLTVELKFSINVAGGAPGDTVDWQLIAYIKGTGDAVTKSQTILVSTTIDAAAQFTKFTEAFTIDYDDVGDPVDIGDDLCFVLTCEATGDVTDVRVTGASYFYNKTHIGIESGDT